MARRVFFSFAYEDVSRAMIVRNSGIVQGADAAGFIDAAEFRKIESGGDSAIQRWIDGQLNGTSVTVVLVAAATCNSSWVKYEIQKSIARGNGLLGVDISQLKDFNGQTTWCCGRIPDGYSFHHWTHDQGYQNLGAWIEQAAKRAGR
jgi:hypothetical protein